MLKLDNNCWINVSNKKILSECIKFSRNITNKRAEIYTRGGQNNINKIFLDVFTGKLSEVFASKILNTICDHQLPVDFNIYKHNIFSPDIKCKFKNTSIVSNISIKSCNIDSKSFVFQWPGLKNNDFRYDTSLFDKPTEKTLYNVQPTLKKYIINSPYEEYCLVGIQYKLEDPTIHYLSTIYESSEEINTTIDNIIHEYKIFFKLYTIASFKALHENEIFSYPREEKYITQKRTINVCDIKNNSTKTGIYIIF